MSWPSIIFNLPHQELLSSTHPSVPHQKPLSSTFLSSTTKTPQLNTETFSVPDRKPLSSTLKTVQHILSSTQKVFGKKPPVPIRKALSFTLKPLTSTPKTPEFKTKKLAYLELFLSLFCVEPRGFRCWTGEFLVLNWGVFGVELRGFRCWTEGFLVWIIGIFGGVKVWPFCVEVMCWTEGHPLVWVKNKNTKFLLRIIIAGFENFIISDENILWFGVWVQLTWFTAL